MKTGLLFQLPILSVILGLSACNTDEPIKKALVEPTKTEFGITLSNPTSESILLSDSTYIFQLHCHQDYSNFNFNIELIKSDSVRYTLENSLTKSVILKYLVDKLPNEQWARTGKDNAYIKGIVSCFATGNNIEKKTANYNFMIPYKPNKPKLALIDTTTTSGKMRVTIGYSAEGATGYKIGYAAYDDLVIKYIEVASKKDTIMSFDSLNPLKRYTITATALNPFGNTESDALVVYKEPVSGMALSVTKVGTTLKYQFALGTQYVTNLDINSVRIYDTTGNLKMSVNAGINQVFSIADLTTGYYLLKVELTNYQIYSKVFAR